MRARWSSAVASMALLGALVPGVARGQTAAGGSAVWGQAGLGASTANLGGLVALSAVRGPHVVSARASFVAEHLDGGEDEAFDVALLYGRQLRRHGTFRPSAAAGLGYVKCEGCDDGRNASSVGLALSVEAALWPTKVAGLGLHGFGNVNSVASFAGVALTIHLGRLR